MASTDQSPAPLVFREEQHWASEKSWKPTAISQGQPLNFIALHFSWFNNIYYSKTFVENGGWVQYMSMRQTEITCQESLEESAD